MDEPEEPSDNQPIARRLWRLERSITAWQWLTSRLNLAYLLGLKSISPLLEWIYTHQCLCSKIVMLLTTALAWLHRTWLGSLPCMPNQLVNEVLNFGNC